MYVAAARAASSASGQVRQRLLVHAARSFVSTSFRAFSIWSSAKAASFHTKQELHYLFPQGGRHCMVKAQLDTLNHAVHSFNVVVVPSRIKVQGDPP